MVDDAARLIVDAFALKLEHEMRARTPEQARRLVAGGMDPDLGLVAVDPRAGVVGVLGVVLRGRRFVDMDLRMLTSEFGLLGAISRWASAAAEHILTHPRKRQWRIQMLAVDGARRGEGIGTALLTTVIDAARQAGMETVGLEVVDVNERALQLYRRLGFRCTFTLPTGRLTARSGFRGVRFMRLDCRVHLPERPSRDRRRRGGAGRISH
jgi:ribosomal protein S18 acetylase RimI-like enzyme